MASQRRTPPPGTQDDPDPQAPEQIQEQAADGAPAGLTRQLAEYLDETPRTYHWTDGPQTVERGDVVVLPDGWETDGRFHPSGRRAPTRLRDNHPDERARTAERQSKARDDVHARLAKEGE